MIGTSETERARKMNEKIPYKKPKIVSCKDCLYYATCMERSRLYPCRDFKAIRIKVRN